MPSHLSAAHTSCASGRSKGKRRRLHFPLAIASAFALFLAGTHLVQRWYSSQGFLLDFSVVSRTPFQEDTPRVGQLTVIHPDGSRETLVSRRYASAFLDLRTTFRFEIADGTVRQVEFFPSLGDGLVGITAISQAWTGSYEVVRVPLDKLVPLSGAEFLERDSARVLVRTTGGDRPAGLSLTLDEPAKPPARPITRIILETLALFVAFLALFFPLVWGLLRKIEEGTFRRNFSLRVVIPFLAAAGLVLTMAVSTKFNAHPDEYLHFETAKYFAHHWLPAALSDAEIAPTFSHYGFSYMRDLDVSYLLMGKFVGTFSAWVSSPEIAARLFNVFLFVVLAGWLASRLGTSLAPFILLISPQVWYVYSYVNGDAWALTVALLIVVQLADEKSSLRRYLQADGWFASIRGGVCFALLLALLIMAKRNYYLFLPFVALVAASLTLDSRGARTVITVGRKWLLILFLTAALYFPVRLGHQALNGFEIQRLQVEQAEKYAAPRFKPSEIAAGTGAGRLVLKKQGVPFADLLTERGWLTESFQSFCGVYQWMSLKGSDFYYLLMGLLYALLISLLLLRIARLSWRDALFAIAVVGIALSVILISAYHSWTADYQPQGRYLFPILPMFAFLFHRYREALRSRAFYLLFGSLFACSIYSFIFIGLRHIPK